MTLCLGYLHTHTHTHTYIYISTIFVVKNVLPPAHWNGKEEAEKQCSQNNHRNMISCFNLHIYHSKLCWLVYACSQNVWPSFNLSLRLFCNVYLSVHNCLNLYLISINVICFFHTVVNKKQQQQQQQWQHTHTNPSVNVICFFHTVVSTLGSPQMWGAYHVDASTPLARCRSSHVYRYIKDTYML